MRAMSGPRYLPAQIPRTGLSLGACGVLGSRFIPPRLSPTGPHCRHPETGEKSSRAPLRERAPQPLPAPEPSKPLIRVFPAGLLALSLCSEEPLEGVATAT